MTAETSNAREWVLAPRVPTEAMLDAMHSRIRILCDPAARTASIQNDREVWAAMLAAAPPAPVSVPLDRLTALDGLVDRIAEAIRDGAGLAEGDPPWERLGEERRAPWRADAKRALSVIKESLTAERGAGVGGPEAQAAEAQLTYKGVPIGPMQTFADIERQATVPADPRAAAGQAIAEALRRERMAPDDYKPMPDAPVPMTTDEEIRMNKQSGYTIFELLVVVIWVVSIGGWIANVVKLFGSIGGEVTTLFILRCIGVLVAPMGVVLGFL